MDAWPFLLHSMRSPKFTPVHFAQGHLAPEGFELADRASATMTTTDTHASAMQAPSAIGGPDRLTFSGRRPETTTYRRAGAATKMGQAKMLRRRSAVPRRKRWQWLACDVSAISGQFALLAEAISRCKE